MGFGMGTAYSPKKDKLTSIYHFQAGPEEKLVMEYLFGMGGQQMITSPTEISKRIGTTANRINQIKKKIYRKLEGK